MELASRLISKTKSARSRLQFFGKQLRPIVTISAVIVLLLVGQREWRYRERFGHFASYGLHTDFWAFQRDIGVPGIQTSYCLTVSNFTFLPIRFEVIQLPGGIVGKEELARTKIEKWNYRTNAWELLVDSAAPDSSILDYPKFTLRIWPGQSFHPAGCSALAALDELRKGDSIRVVALTSFTKPDGDPEQSIFYSPTLVLTEERVRSVATSTRWLCPLDVTSPNIWYRLVP